MSWLVAGDTVVHFAVRALSAPIAVFARVNDGFIEIVSQAGLDDPMPRQAGVHDEEVTAQGGVVLVPDIAADPRFAAGAWARVAAGARAAALVAVADREGRRVGVLAVLDTKPRAWTAADAEVLASFAGGLHELHTGVERRAEDLRAANERLSQEVEEGRRAAARYRAVVGHLPGGGVAMFDHDLRCTLIVGARVESAGLAGTEGQTLREALSPETADRVEPVLREVLRGNSSVTEVADGGRTYRVHGMPVRNEDGEITAAILVAQEITPRLAAEEARQESEERYRVLFEKAGKAIYIMRAQGAEAGALLDANTTAAAMHGYEVAELRAMHAVDLLASPVLAGTLNDIQRAAEGAWVEGEGVHVRKDGTRFPVEYSAGPIGVGEKRAVVVFLRDITERRREEDLRREAREAAEAASRAKSVFLAHMSHELRTPMNAILGYTQLLQRDPGLERRQREHLDVISRSGEHLLQLLNDVLEMSKIEAGHRSLAHGPVDLDRLLDDLLQTFRLRAQAKHLAFEIRRAPGVPHDILGDEGKLRQVLFNLLGNAVKFTERGGVTARLFVRPADAGKLRLVAEIEDTGPGLSAQEIAGLFQPFAQGHAGAGKSGGTGLGLAISRELARLMGGDITVESHVDQGSVFRVEVSIEPSSTPSPSRSLPPSERVVGLIERDRGARILIVDDEQDNRGWLRELLQTVGFDVREASDGAEAVAGFEPWHPRLVLMDMSMPVLDGYAAMRAIRALPSGKSVALVALTASALDDAREAIFAAGADGWLRKPCREADILDEIRRCLLVEYRYAPPSDTPPREVPGLRRGALTPELTTTLRRAALLADYEHLHKLIEEIPPECADVAEELRHLLESYAYDKIQAVLLP